MRNGERPQAPSVGGGQTDVGDELGNASVPQPSQMDGDDLPGPLLVAPTAVKTRSPFTVAGKINPLANWTWGDVWHYIRENGVAYNPLHDQFFPSIGCAPCTRAISLGEDFRAGRWWWEDENAKECGLHVK